MGGTSLGPQVCSVDRLRGLSRRLNLTGVFVSRHHAAPGKGSMYGRRVSRRTLIAYALVTLAVVVLFALFIGFKRDAALIGALSAAGAVAAAGFAALAAMGSMRAANESSATARRSQEALARTMRPRIHPSASLENRAVLGKVHRGEGRAAVDVTVVWVLTNHDTVTDRTVRLDTAFAVDLGLPETANVWEEISMVWIEYWDDNHVGHWRDTWQVGTEPESRGTFVQTHSQLVD